MYTLSRTVRFVVSAAPEPPATDHNSYAGVPAMHALGAHYELTLACTGHPHPVTGYVISIADLDRAARNAALPLITKAFREHPERQPSSLLPELATAISAELTEQIATLTNLHWHLSPFYSVAMTTAAPNAVTLRQRFEFSASHRLHAPQLTDEENLAAYGKCNNPSGHGHNYVVEPAVTIDPTAAPAFALADLERLTIEYIINRFDHKHLNTDLDDFTNEVASVEHIAKRCYDLLADQIKTAGAHLTAITVWETEKTSCTYQPD